MANKEASSTGIGFLGALALIFITLKLIGKITWSWWYVLMPIWIIPFIIISFLLIVLGVPFAIGFVIFIFELFEKDKNK